MITVYPYDSLGSANLGWLDTHYHFSFADYHNPSRMGFGHLRVINDDTIQPGQGFPTHHHRDMEIITYVTQGAVSHKDSEGHAGRTEAGNVQVMTAGSGIFHSEYNLESIETKLLQIWIKPNSRNLEPGWKSHQFPTTETADQLMLLVSGDGQAPLHINQDARIFAGNLRQGASITHDLQANAYIVLVQGQITADDVPIRQGDGAEVTDCSRVTIKAVADSQILLIEV